jgi:hypothetical protein
MTYLYFFWLIPSSMLDYRESLSMLALWTLVCQFDLRLTPGRRWV